MEETDSYNKFAVWLATGLGVGLVSPAPGTVGGLWGLPLAWTVGLLPTAGSELFVVVLIGLTGVAICSAAARSLGSRKDPGAIVFDEIAALPIVFLGVEPASWSVWIGGWLLFRVFDIAKPPPIRWFERLPAGWGVMADDCVAAVYAGISLHILLWLDRVADWSLFAVA